MKAAFAWCAFTASFFTLGAAASERLEYNRDIKPILSENCFKCHGPDAQAREAKLRLDLRSDAILEHGSGGIPIVPGNPDQSEVVLRTEAKDPDDRMPPSEAGDRLSPSQLVTLRRWIAEGAEYQPHWSFVTPKAAALPPVNRVQWPRNAIDRFVLAQLEQTGLEPRPEADKPTLLRRVSFDLTGLPPTLRELDAFLADSQPNAYERAVDRLLSSPRYGERMATDWLDAARYGDSNGFFRDNPRQIWPWRDWVIQAFNRNLPFDQFTMEQLAGDLLPNATAEQKIATGFNRNHMVSGEGGIIDEEYRVQYVADRLETTASVWLGLTVGCARCHDHKFDPISQRDYFQLYAFFNSGVEKGRIDPDDPPPVMDVASPIQRAELETLRVKRAAAEAELEKSTQPLRLKIAEWELNALAELSDARGPLAAHVDFEPEGPASAAAFPRTVEKGNIYHEAGVIGQAARFDGMQHLELPADFVLGKDQAWTVGAWIKPAASIACIVSKIEPTGDRRGVELIWAKGKLQVNLVHR